MSEIKKMYELAGVKQVIPKMCSNNERYCKGCKCYNEGLKNYCNIAHFPEFSAKKQMQILNFIIDKYDISINKRENPDRINICADTGYTLIGTYVTADTFMQALASILNQLWVNLTIQEQQQIKEILQ